MQLNRYVNITSNLLSENRLLKLAVIVLTLGFIWCAVSIKATKDKIRVVVVPPVLNTKVEISGTWTTDSYVREYMRYVSALAWNYSYATARSQFGELVVSFHPSRFEAAKQELYLLVTQIEKTRASSSFYISKIEHKAEQGVVEVTGNRRVTQNDTTQTENTEKTFVVSYIVENGRFWLTGISEKAKPGSTPAAPSEPLQVPEGGRP